jgi:hypothetical protein
METFYLRKIFEKLKEFWKLILKKHIFFHNIMEKKIENYKSQKFLEYLGNIKKPFGC